MRFSAIGRLTVATIAMAVVGFGLTSSPADAVRTHHKHHAAGGNTVPAVIGKTADLKELSCALCCSGLKQTLSGKGPYTVFAPSDEAFKAMNKGTNKCADKDACAKTLKYHVVAGKLTAADLAGKRSVTTLEGESLMINSKDGKIIVDGAIVTQPDINASNGVIHVIDTVLVPERGK